MKWNRFILFWLGLWPKAQNNLRFYAVIVYYSCCMILEYLDLFPHLDDLEYVIMNLTENIGFSELYIKLLILRVYNEDLLELISETGKDFDPSRYESVEERKAFTAHLERARLFIKILLGIIFCSATSYYFTPILGQLQFGMPEVRVNENETRLLYLLPYRFRILYPVEDIATYVITYVMFLPLPIILSFTQSVSDSMMITLVSHICGQMSILAMRINQINADSSKCREEIRSVIKMHTRLLRMGKVVEQAYSGALLCDLFCSITLVCIVGYQLLTNLDSGDKVNLVKFISFQALLLMMLHAHCYIGEALLTESTKVCEAFYNVRWYDMQISNARKIMFCIARSQKPLCLRSGKLGIFRLNTMTDVLKTSMGYLSVLRSFL